MKMRLMVGVLCDRNSDGQTPIDNLTLVYRLKGMWSDGSTCLVYKPQDFMAKLATAR
jgi:hypothetical protein